MQLNLMNTHYITNGLVLVLFTIQFLEFYFLKSTLSDMGPWSWTTIHSKFECLPTFLKKTLKVLLKYPNFLALLSFRWTLTLISLYFPFPTVYFLILLSTLVFLYRWKNPFNGGSDYMSIVLLFGLLVNSITVRTEWREAGLYYIAFHSLYSYFKAGWVKIVRPEWRNGKVLKWLVKSSPYKHPLGIFDFIGHSKSAAITCWFVIVFELTIPFTILSPPVLIIFLFLGILFHGFIVYIFGLNRFFWAWLATYPSVIYTSLSLRSLV